MTLRGTIQLMLIPATLACMVEAFANTEYSTNASIIGFVLSLGLALTLRSKSPPQKPTY